MLYIKIGVDLLEEENKFSDKDYIVSIFLCFFFGVFGIHRIYCYKVKTGMLYLFILILGIVLEKFCYYKNYDFYGFCRLPFYIVGILMLVDLVLIIFKRFKDKEGKIICYSKFFKKW